MRSSSPLRHYGQGLLMGTADVIPGVSGGTVALIVGIYEGLIGSVRAVATSAVRLLRGDTEGARSAFGQTQWGLIIPLGLGIVTALLLGASIIPGLLERYPSQMAAIFMGLIAGSLVVPWRRIRSRGPREVVIAVAAAVVAFVLVSLPPQSVEDPSLGFVFLAASVAICAMILPGVSGAFLLLVLGVYGPTLEALRSANVPYVAIFVLGAAIGLGAFSKLLGYLLERRHDTTMAALVGLMAGSLRALWPWLDENRGLQPPPNDLLEVLFAIALALIGFAAVTVLVRAGTATDQRVHVPPVEA